MLIKKGGGAGRSFFNVKNFKVGEDIHQRLVVSFPRNDRTYNFGSVYGAGIHWIRIKIVKDIKKASCRLFDRL